MLKNLYEEMRSALGVIGMATYLILTVMIISVVLLGADPTITSGIIAFIGAIVGGVVSGLLTLRGVTLTIKNQHEKDYIDSLPEKLYKLDLIISYLKVEKAEFDFKVQQRGELSHMDTRSPFFKILTKIEKEFLEQASNINVTVYKLVRDYYDYLVNRFLPNRGETVLFTQKEVQDRLTSIVGDLSKEQNRLIKQFEEYEKASH